MKLYWPKESSDWKELVLNLQKKDLLSPFHPKVLIFVQALSKRLLKDVRFRRYPELIALGYWLRRKNLHDMKEIWTQQTKEQFVRARGTVFHLAPSNVDTIFVYSWMLSLLAGNRNIIRISSKEQPQTSELLTVMLELLRDPEHTIVAERTILLTYHHDESLTAYISSHCHTRVIWGGDETVNAIRRIPLAPMANELVFPDRFSLALINAQAFIDTNEKEREHLLQQFYNDSFWFDQMACSSPRLLIWTGNPATTETAQSQFWPAFEEVVRKKGYELMPALQVQKLATSLWLAVEDETKTITQGLTHTRVLFNEVPIGLRERHCGGGLFYEYAVSELRDATSMIVDKDQTVAYFGFEKDELMDFASLIMTRGIDRIVPIGQALNFDGVWDGQSFLRSFTREIVII